MEFTKAEVFRMIDELKLSPMTPTDIDHQADWWNTTFGLHIKSEFEVKMEELKARIATLRDVPFIS